MITLADGWDGPPLTVLDQNRGRSHRRDCPDSPGTDPDALARALAAAAVWGSCRIGEVLKGGGDTSATVRFACDKGPLDVSITLDPASGRLSQATLAPAADEACVP